MLEFLEQREQTINPKIYSLPSRDKNNLWWILTNIFKLIFNKKPCKIKISVISVISVRHFTTA